MAKNNKYNSKDRDFKKGRSQGKPAYERDDNRGGKKFCPYGTKSYDAIRSNNIKWWNKADGIYSSAVRVPFNKISGAPYLFGSNVIHTNASNNVTYETNAGTSLPVAMRVQYTPGIGVCDNMTDAPNRAFQQMYSAIYSKTSGVLEFTGYSLAMYVICAQSIAQNLALAKRALEISNCWTAVNVAFPKLFLHAMGFNPESVLDHQNEIEAQLNTRIRDFNSIKIPAYIDVFERHYALAHNVYADQDSLRSQFYMFVPECYYVFSDLGMYDASSKDYDGLLTALAIGFPWRDGTTTINFGDLMDIIDIQIKAIRNSADYLKISGALQRAFPESSFLTIDQVTSNDVRVPEVDDVISYQVHNAVAVGNNYYTNRQCPHVYEGYKPMATTACITGSPVTGIVSYKPEIRYTNNDNLDLMAGHNKFGYILNTFDNTASDDFIMQSTRLMSDWDRNPSNNAIRARSLGTEYVNRFYIYRMVNYDMAGGQDEIEVQNVPTVLGFSHAGDTVGDVTLSDMMAVLALDKFHRAPRVPFVRVRTDEGGAITISTTSYSGDLHFWTTVDSSALAGLNTAALLSVFSTDAKVDVK